MGCRLVDGKAVGNDVVGAYVGRRETVGAFVNTSSFDVIRLTSIGKKQSSVPLISMFVVFKKMS